MMRASAGLLRVCHSLRCSGLAPSSLVGMLRRRVFSPVRAVAPGRRRSALSKVKRVVRVESWLSVQARRRPCSR